MSELDTARVLLTQEEVVNLCLYGPDGNGSGCGIMSPAGGLQLQDISIDKRGNVVVILERKELPQ